jgi:DNA repair exonuclease SbcCD ATPase subunit
MSYYHPSYKSEKQSTGQTVQETYTKSRSHPQLPRSSENSFAVANCIRGLNSTIENLLKEKQSLTKSVEELKAKETGIETAAKLKKIKEKNEGLKKKVKEMTQINSDLHERYNQVKEMYDLLAEKQKNVEKIGMSKQKHLENSELLQENKRLKQVNSEFLIEIQNLKKQVAGYKKKVEDMEKDKQFVVEEQMKSGKFVNEIAQINEELLNYIKDKSRKHKKHSCYKTSACSKKVSKVPSERNSFGHSTINKHITQ